MHTKILCTLVLSVLASVGFSAERLSNGYTQAEDTFFRAGFWWNPAQDGVGVDIHMANGRMVVTWATYDANRNPTWYLGVGDQAESGNWIIPLSEYRWDGTEIDEGTQVGEIDLSFTDGYHAQMQWRLGDLTGGNSIEAFVVDEQPVAEDMTGFWYRTNASGYGQSIATQGNKLYGVVYLYDREGRPTWVWVDNLNDSTSGALNALRMSNGPCPGCTVSELRSESAGEAELTFLSENEAVWSLNVAAGPDGQTQSWRLSNQIVRQLTDRASGREERYQLRPFTNPQMLHQYLQAGLNGGANYPSARGGFDFSLQPPRSDVSVTNLQEAGVDEADLIKSDGQFVYAVQPRDYATESPASIRILAMSDESPELTELSSLPLATDDFEIAGIYLVDGSESDTLLVMMNQLIYHDYDIWFGPTSWINTKTRVIAINIEDRTAPAATVTLDLDGGLVADRRIEDQLYLVTRYIPPATEEPSSLDELLPSWYLDGVRQGALVDRDRVLLPPQPPAMNFPDLITVSAIDLGALTAAPKTETFAGLAETVYVSTNNLFISSSRFGFGFDPSRADLPPFGSQPETDIHQFALDAGGPSYQGSGAAGGILAWGGLSPAFRFSEHAGTLRVMTTLGNWFDSTQQLTVLNLADAKRSKLGLRGFIPNESRPELIGKIGEDLRGVRFMGDRLYAVTFERIDPFYVVDISTASDPYVAGELEITGFSEYLHPLSEDLVIGFGAEVDPQTGQQKGLQLSLFDVSDPNAPSLLQREILGGAGSYSPLLHDHHAFSILPGNADRAPRIGIPVGLAEERAGRFSWLGSGLARFEVSGLESESPELIWSDTIFAAQAQTGDPQPNISFARGLLSSENSYLYLSDGQLYGAPWGNPQAVGPF